MVGEVEADGAGTRIEGKDMEPLAVRGGEHGVVVQGDDLAVAILQLDRSK